MTVSDWGWTVGGLMFGGFVGLITGTLVVLLYSGLWVLAVLALPLLLLQFLFEGAIAALVRLWKSWRGHQPSPKPTPCHLRTHLPRLRRYSFHIGLFIGTGYGLLATQPF